jgi:GxxExxY protein
VQLKEVTRLIIGSAIKVHCRLGPGMLENTYEVCLAYELEKVGLKVRRQVGLPVIYDGVELEIGYKLDLLVEDQVVVEIKAQEGVLPVHKAQLLSYLRLSGRPVGLLINFHEVLLKDGIIRKVNNYKEPSASSQVALATSALTRFETPVEDLYALNWLKAVRARTGPVPPAPPDPGCPAGPRRQCRSPGPAG